MFQGAYFVVNTVKWHKREARENNENGGPKGHGFVLDWLMPISCVGFLPRLEPRARCPSRQDKASFLNLQELWPTDPTGGNFNMLSLSRKALF